MTKPTALEIVNKLRRQVNALEAAILSNSPRETREEADALYYQADCFNADVKAVQGMFEIVDGAN